MTDNSETLAPVRAVPRFRAVRRVDTSSLGGLAALINADDRNKRDYSLDYSQLEFTDRRTLAVPTPNGTQEYGFSPDSFERFATGLLGIPSKFLNEQPLTGAGSQQDIVNQRLSAASTKPCLVRVREAPTDEGLHGVLRSVLPGDYTPFDNRHLLAAVTRATREHGLTLEVKASNANDPMTLERGFHMRLLGENEYSLSGDSHKFGIYAYTSEVAMDTVDVSAMLWRLLCSNGLMGWGDSQVLHQRHKGVQTHELGALVVEASYAALRQAETTIELVERLRGKTVDDVHAFLTGRVARGMKLSDGFLESVQSVYRSSYQNDETHYGVMQAMTEAAQGLPPSERAKMETKIGNFFLSMLGVTSLLSAALGLHIRGPVRFTTIQRVQSMEISQVGWETALITSIISNNDIRVALRKKVTPDHFHGALQKNCYDWLIRWFNNPEYGDTPSWESFLDAFPNFEAEVVEDSTAALCDKVRSYKIHSDITEALVAVAEETRASSLGGLEALKRLTSQLISAHQEDNSTNMVDMAGKLREEYLAMKAGEVKLKGKAYPWPALNDATLGFRDGQLVVFYARPKSFKSWLAIEVMRHLHAQGETCVIFSQELSEIEIARRWVALEARIDYPNYLRGACTEEEEARFEECLDRFLEEPPVIIDRLTGTGEAAVTEMGAKVADYNATSICVDGMYFLGEDWRELALLTRGFKRVARERNIRILGVTQQNRAKNEKGGSDVAYGDSFLQDCDLLLKFFRDGQHRRERKVLATVAAIREGTEVSFTIHAKLCENMTQDRVIVDASDEDEGTADVPTEEEPLDLPE